MEILGRERRRRWSTAERLEIVAAVGVNGETLARVARRYDVSRSQIYQWRHQFRKRGLLPAPTGPTFLPVDLEAPMRHAEPVPEDIIASPVIVELCLAQGRRLRFDAGIEAAALTRLIRSVEAA
ncbi:transposase [Sphingobium sp. PNB]|uniref:IS66-like element accessory protein TnpA n=1 Tax=Sphingobium sp. PNB TaxID=863934 RepID=UPI001CA3AE59|nr:transposase [Sphingobium sp. PNB]MCB4862610.1 transposase [Sphingobium sp. PNB]